MLGLQRDMAFNLLFVQFGKLVLIEMAMMSGASLNLSIERKCLLM